MYTINLLLFLPFFIIQVWCPFLCSSFIPYKVEKSEWRSIVVNYTTLHKHYLKLSKIKLTSLVVLTTVAGYALAPAPYDFYTFTMCSLGTGLVSAAANAINQFFEVPFDAQMSRTKIECLLMRSNTSSHRTGCTDNILMPCWAGCTDNILMSGAWILPGILYMFPHFNALSWNLRPDYSRAGYRMMAVTNPNLCRRITVRYTIALMTLCT